jgi:hypothetical protein
MLVLRPNPSMGKRLNTLESQESGISSNEMAFERGTSGSARL